MLQLREPYTPDLARRRSTRPLTRVGIDDVPLKEKPTIPTKSDAADYMNLLQGLRNSFSEDIDKNVVAEDPETYHDASEDNIKKAFGLDGCMGIVSCTPDGADDSEPSPAGTKEWWAWSYRNKAAHQLARARYLEDIWDRRGLKKADLPKDLAFEAEFDAWDDRRKVIVGQVESWSSFDFGEIQRLDLDLQKLRRRYTEVTGLEPSMAWPSGVPNTPNTLVNLAYVALAVAGIGILVYGAVHLFPTLMPASHATA